MFKPRKLLLKYKGYDVFIEGDNATENYEKFEAISTECRLMIEHAVKEIYKYEGA